MKTEIRIKIRGYHEDRFGHVNNARYLELLEEARWAHLEARGVGSDFLTAHRVFPVVVRITIAYRRPASTGDELSIATWVAGGGRRKIVLGQQARFTSSDEICVEAEVTVVFLDEETGRPITLSEELLDAWPELRSVLHAGD